MKAVFFDIDNTLYSYDQGNEAGMKALTSYAENNLQVSAETFMQAFRQARKVVEERIGMDCAATHNRLIRIQCILEILKKPLYPHAKMMYHRYWDNLNRFFPAGGRSRAADAGVEGQRSGDWDRHRHDGIYSV